MVGCGDENEPMGHSTEWLCDEEGDASVAKFAFHDSIVLGIEKQVDLSDSDMTPWGGKPCPKTCHQ